MTSGWAVWFAAAAATAIGLGDLDLRLLLVLFVPLVVVPRSVELIDPGLPVRFSTGVRSGLRVGAHLALASAFVSRGTLSAVVAGGWLMATTVLAVAVAVSFLGARPRAWTAERLLGLVAVAWLPAAAAWLVASRGGLAPFGFGEPLTLLTSAHFHVAGHATTTLSAVVVGRLERLGGPGGPGSVGGSVGTGSPSWRRVALVAASCTTSGPLAIAAGWQTGYDALHVVGAVLLTVGIGALSLATFAATRGRRELAARLVRVAAVVPAVPMGLALWYSVSRNASVPAPSLELMARTHGLANAVGFAGLSISAWAAMPRR